MKMSLDKFGLGGVSKSSEKPVKKSSIKKKAKKTSETEDTAEESKVDSSIKPTTEGRKKYHLKCSSTKCTYDRVLNKKELNEDDYVCRKCGQKMKVTKMG
jgi:predicted SprT family Zn-dependent metalloprotease